MGSEERYGGRRFPTRRARVWGALVQFSPTLWAGASPSRRTLCGLAASGCANRTPEDVSASLEHLEIFEISEKPLLACTSAQATTERNED